MKKITTTQILWAVFFALLLVLLPHTAWMFRQFEPLESEVFAGSWTWADVVSYVAAFAFEAAIAVLIHKLAKRIEETPKRMTRGQKFVYQYLNAISFGLLVATLVSGMANLAHAVQFGQVIKIFTEWGIEPKVYSFAFGGILPLVSLTFARVLSNVVENEELPNPELTEAKQTIAALRKQVHDLRDTEERANKISAKWDEVNKRLEDTTLEYAELKDKFVITEERARIAEERFGAAGDLMRRIFSENKQERIIAVKQWRPQLTGQAIAIIAETSPSYVSEVLNTETVEAQ